MPSLAERIQIASGLYHLVRSRFESPTSEVSMGVFEHTYENYVKLLPLINRRDFYLETLALLGSLHSGHTWVRDREMEEQAGAPTGLKVFCQNSTWIVVESRQAGVSPGDVILSIDGTSIEQFFADHQRYIAASSERAARSELFSYGILFPAEFTLTLASGAIAKIRRAGPLQTAASEPLPSARWLATGRVAYIRIPAMLSPRVQVKTLDLLEDYRRAAVLVVDVRGIRGGDLSSEPREFQAELIGDPYWMWRERARIQLASVGGDEDYSEISTPPSLRQSQGKAFSGRVMVLIDRECMSVCESFVMPFKGKPRVKLIGEATAGTFALTVNRELAPGLEIKVATTVEDLPDGRQFEGVGIEPDVAVPISTSDLRQGRDSALMQAVRLSKSQP